MGKVFDVTGLADHWGCSADIIYGLIRGGELQAFKLGGKLIRIRAEEVEKFECQTITPSNDTEANMPSPGMKADDATDIRLERLIGHRPTPQHARSGSGAR